MADATAGPAAQPSSMAHQAWSSAMHEMHVTAMIQKHSGSVSPVVTPTTKAIKSLCLPSIAAGGVSSSTGNVLQPSYITVNPSATGGGSLPLIAAQGMPGAAQVIQGTPIAVSMAQLGDLGGASIVQLAPIGYAGGHGNEASLQLQAAHSFSKPAVRPTLHQPTSEDINILYEDGKCQWPGCGSKVNSRDRYISHLSTEHNLSSKTQAQTIVQSLVVDQLDKQLQTERGRFEAMKRHLNISDPHNLHLLTSLSHDAPSLAATPTSSPPTMTSLTSLGQIKQAAGGPGVPLVQAVYTDQNGQPLYIVQHMNQPTLIPIQAAGGGGQSVAVTSMAAAPTSLKIDQGGRSPLTLHTPPPMHVASPGGPKSVLANTYTPPKLDSLIQPCSTRLIPIPHVNGGSFQSLSLGEGPGPVRSHTRQAARERPSPVAYDESQEALRKAMPRYSNIDQRPPFTYASLIRQVL
ncbi:Forkhead box protein P4 [Geodia barretti]|uniref:Forkhead box protein P4 n=1 Tax=Geodia barretti TaxID=519541 RepID=A0AA35SJ00_GEOBA|nr:Forkhead box protein P4 [Geodia barretti]